MEDPLTKRRRLLQGAGVSGATLLAGCLGLFGSDDEAADPDEGSNGNDTDGGDGPDSDDTGGDTGDDTDDDTGDDTGSNDSDDDTSGDDTSGDDSGDDEDVGIELGEGDTREVGVVVAPDQAALQDLRERMQAGEIERQAAIEEQQQIIQDSADELVAAIENDTSLEVTENLGDLGVLRVVGDAFELVDTLSSSRATALVPPSDLDEVQQTPDQG
ncbi:hypothetical protein BRC65_08930 [Halobacteriales archaeon QH_2_65_14]|nr:MAG: hypothetical protein BRC65_08930 [Halobacteriales archaeon QH_2_65_14]